MVRTNQGLIPIGNVTTDHTINDKEITGISKTLYTQDRVINIERNAFGINQPSKKMTVAPYHRFVIEGELIPIYTLVNGETVYYKKYRKELLYNIILDKPGLMIVNNMIVETLNPSLLIAKIFNNTLPKNQRKKVIKSIINYHNKLKEKKDKKLLDYIV